MFAIPCIKAVDGDEGAAIVFNACLLRLMQRRRHQIAAEGDDEKSIIAWKLAAFQQAVLYRVGLLHGQIGWFFTLENPAGVNAGQPVSFCKAASVDSSASACFPARKAAPVVGKKSEDSAIALDRPAR